jgi:hypothetical protein
VIEKVRENARRAALLKDRVGAVVLAVAFRGPMGWLSNRLPAGDGLAY